MGVGRALAALGIGLLADTVESDQLDVKVRSSSGIPLPPSHHWSLFPWAPAGAKPRLEYHQPPDPTKSWKLSKRLPTR